MLPLRLLAAAALLLLLATARPAAADDAATRGARKHYEKGEKLFALGRFEEALESYEKAFETKPLPGFLFNIGQCHRNLGDYESAIFSFRKYLKLKPEADNREAVLELIDELEIKMEQAEEDRQRRALRDSDPPTTNRDDRGKGKPIYKKWWFWGGVAAVAGASVGTFVLLRDDGVPDTDLGHVVFR